MLPTGPPAGLSDVVAVAPGRVEVFTADTRERRLLRAGLAVDGPGEPPQWKDLGSLPAHGGLSVTCLAATQRDLFLGCDDGLWHSVLGARLGWEHLGGDFAEDSLLAAVSSAGGRTDVFAVWADAALVHRWFDTAWSDWQLVALLSGSPDGYSVLRPDDLVTLTVTGAGLTERVQPDGTVQWVAGAGGGRLLVEVPPQHLAETVAESGLPVQGYLAGPSTLSFAVGQDPVTLTVDGLLDAMNRLTLVTTGAVAGDVATRLELPWRLLLGLQTGARCAHRTRPATGVGGGTELWHSRVAVPDAGLTVRSITALPGGTGLGTPLDAWLDQIAAAATANPGRPATVDRLILSPYGARFSATAHWPQLEWTHDAAQGRDCRVRVAASGALFPFGHRAAYVEVDERRFDTADPAVASLHQKAFLVITEPVRDDYGIGAGGSHERRFPFQRIAIDPGQSGELDTAAWIPLDPGSCNARCFWPRRGGVPIVFTLQARAGQTDVELDLPLLFAEDGATGAGCAAALDQVYAKAPAAGAFASLGRPSSDIGSRIPLAMASATKALEGAVQEVRSMTFGGLGVGSLPGTVGFYPQVTQLAVGLPAVRQLLGPLPALPATISQALVDTPLGKSPPDALLELMAPRTLDFGAAGARVGSLAAPTMAVTTISRRLGPVVGDALPTNPADLFPQDASLFGVVQLRQLISTISDRPQLTWIGEDTPTPSAELKWDQTPLRAVGPFQPIGAGGLHLDVQAQMVDGRPELHATGTVDAFRLVIPPGPLALVTFSFDHVIFTADAGKRMDLDVKLSNVELNGNLKFLRTLQDLIPTAGRNGPRIDTSAVAVRASYTLLVPSAGLMVFSLQNLTIEIAVTLSLTNRPIVIDFAFGTREKPFLVTVAGFGGGGYLELGLGAGEPDSGLQRLTGGIEFGASIDMDFTIASAEVHVFGGVVFAKNGRDTEITGYLRIGGSVSVLGLISVSIELTLSLTYDVDTNVLSGSATLVITVDLTFFSKTVTLECHKSFGGSSLAAASTGPALAAGPDPSSVEVALGPQGSSFPWQTYCQAFAGE
ncbi:hypothetical protein ACIRRH_30770 [Kitasatospora sp. NPDC101235]|uniref:hypothetical protein n=1 Tax=Kitasatospora sp. NPDC101235 TaxID=3364101 RepID=UPI003810FB0E